jgi:hypothetical protein
MLDGSCQKMGFLSIQVIKPLMLSESLNPNFLILTTELTDIENYMAALVGIGFAVSALRELIRAMDDERVIIAPDISAVSDFSQHRRVELSCANLRAYLDG